MFYHARVSCKPERAKESGRVGFEFDLSREDLLSKIALPFMAQKQFFCGGVIVHAQKVDQVKFSQTDAPSADLVPMIQARRRLRGVISGSPAVNQVVSEGKDVTREILDEASMRITNSKRPGESAEEKIKPKSDRVFIVHGRDQNAVDQTELLLHRFGLTPIILRNTPSKGNTVIEKFEANVEVGAAIVLLTPDDSGGLAGSAPQPRARQNVIWEWGYLVAKLGRPNVICLYKTGVELPSDLHGLVTIHISDDVRDKAEEIRRELNAAGYDIK